MLPYTHSRPEGSEAQLPATAADLRSTNPDHIGGYKVAVPIFRGIESKFGLFLPKYAWKPMHKLSFSAAAGCC